MMYLPGEGSPGAPGWSTASFHKETFMIVLGTCLALTAMAYLMYTCVKNGSCLPTFIRGHFRQTAAVRYWNSPTAPECGVTMHSHPNLQPMLAATPYAVHDPAPHLVQQPRQFVYPKLDEMDMRPAASRVEDNRRKGAAFAASYVKA